MHVAQLALDDFRSYATVAVTLEPGVTVLIGRNGQGKTNLVEAVGYVATLGSHRVATDAPLVRHGADRAVVRVAVVKGDRRATVEIEINPGKANRARLNRAPAGRPRDVLGLLRVVLFAPEDLALVKGDPGERRRFVDDLLVARAPRFAAVRTDYDRVLKQRNALLKSAAASFRGGRRPSALPTLEVWDAHLVEAGSELLAARLELVEVLSPLVTKAYEAVAGQSGPAVLGYRGSVFPDDLAGEAEELSTARGQLADAFRAALERARPQELERGVSLVGPHRDDLLLRLGELPARGYASHGESWSFALALRLAAYDLLRADGDDPVLLLDDVFAELDTRRRDRLAELVSPAEQVIVTAAVADDVPTSLAGARFDVSEGVVTRVQ
ncbi:MAG: DNA replication/repair protein RecF [Streptosporangiales bacterium]|nr:DNA replication/repair protein RecF [Streptosporangiales bacterium]